MKKRLVVIGHGMVGNKLVESLVRRGAARTWDITVVGEEPLPAYDRVHLSRLFEGASPEDLSLSDPEVYSVPGVSLRRGERVISIDPEAKVVRTKSGSELRYDIAVLATGSSPFVPDIPGRDLPGCFVYRTVEDVEALRMWANGRQHGVVVGGGLLGLEAANALRCCGLATEVVEMAPWLMPAQVDEVGGELLQQRIEALGLAVHCSTTIAAVLAGDDGAVSAVSLHGPDDAFMATEMVVFAAGIRPRDELARSCGLDVGPRGGVAIDAQCRTSDPSIFAIGECALFDGRVFGLVSPGYQMARVAAETICGGDASFEAGQAPTKLKLLGVDVASFGDAHAKAAGSSTICFTDRVALVHKRLVVDRNGRLVGGVLVGDAAGFELMSAIAAGDLPTPETPAALITTAPGEGGEASLRGQGPSGLPASATICSCENVTKGAIAECISECIASTGAADVAAVKNATRAGTGCGGCVPQLAELVKASLAAKGIEVPRSLCEHFAFSRQEIYDLVRVGQISTFAELHRRHGSGKLGCDICKPVVASILASLTGRHILDGEGASLQDTNDHFLANLQRDGTYSVVPRVPGGEITPEKMIVLGEVAREFSLYVKITGGQRIDLLGAHVDDLPAIWARLVDAGFESGHAYGKAVRTVKSCVGTNWCRFGVQDSTKLAIDLELRYRGLRSPHKIKMAVSGCARECAEAQGKDVGVIATERGWNLYVCGNGGARPRHADLLAEDLDSVELVRLIDRFLMFYIRTADRLQRTSSWLEAMEGGIAHLRQVVVDDSLGIAEELEAQMGHHIANYRCEWADTLLDPARLRRFRTFVNSEARDPDIVVVTERSQPRPAYQWERVELVATRSSADSMLQLADRT